MARVARDLAAIERDEDPPAAARAAIAAADDHRRSQGRPPLADEHDRPEEGFYRRARALGLVPRRR